MIFLGEFSIAIYKASVGDTIRIIHLSGEDSRYDGATGVVTHIDDMGQLHGTWGGLAVIPEEDDFVVEG